MSIETILTTYETALNNNDIDTILSLYGETPVFMPQHAAALVGRDAVRAGYAHVFDTIKLSIRFDVHEVQEAGDWAWARTSSAGRTRVLASGAEISEGNNELFIFRREDGSWKIHRYLFSTNQPPRA
ncbi:MAG: nuclear transport factor 2 family protein [Vicinamibacterales bacterium]